MSYLSFNVVTSKHACSFIGGVEVFDIRGEGIPAATYLRGSYHHLITIRVYGFTVPQILFPCSQTHSTTASMLPLLPGRVPIYRSRFAASHTDPIVGTSHPLEVKLLSGVIAPFLFHRELWMMGTEIPLDTISLQCSCIYLHCRASALHVIPEIINEDNVSHTLQDHSFRCS